MDATKILEGESWSLEDSFDNYHVEGVEYLCLRRSRLGTIKLYRFVHPVPNSWGHLVWPHDHAYDFGTTLLSGSIDNLLWGRERSDGANVSRYSYEAQPDGGGSTVWQEHLNLRRFRTDHHAPGDSWWTLLNEIHTLELKSETAMLLIQQYPTIRPSTSMYAPLDVEIGDDFARPGNLYRPLSQEKALDMKEEALAAIHNLGF